MVIGISAAVWLFAPKELPELMLGAAAAAAGSLISDLDEEHSHAGRRGAKAAALCVIAAVLMIFSDLFLKTGIYAGILSRLKEATSAAAVLVFILLCAFGYFTEHRSFLHSIPGTAVLTFCVRAVEISAAPYFLAGMISHIALDLFNRKGIRLFYPFRKRFCLGWFKAGGATDRFLFRAGVVSLAAALARTGIFR